MGIKKEEYRFVDTPLFDGIQSVLARIVVQTVMVRLLDTVDSLMYLS